MQIKRSDIQLRADSRRVIVNYLDLGVVRQQGRIHALVQRVLDLSNDDATILLREVEESYSDRHSQLDFFLLRHFERVSEAVPESFHLTPGRKKLIGAFFTKEYAIQGAALFNPSIIAHPDQSDVPEGKKKFLCTLRSAGEGHISSIEFREGSVNVEGQIQLDAVSPFSTTCVKWEDKKYDRAQIIERMNKMPGFNTNILLELPAELSYRDYLARRDNRAFAKYDVATHALLEDYFDTNYDVKALEETTISERVIFPMGKKESNGMEDVRMVAFNDGKELCYIGTYTAYDGHSISPQMILTTDFGHFKIRAMYGEAVHDKGMALFPEKVNGQYAMLGRQGGQNISIMYTDDLYHWDTYQTLMEPEAGWGLVQLGNCGSPLKTKDGWLVITHAVGPMRQYVISAILLDLENPSKIIKKLGSPLMAPNEMEREGYVPNVLYSCGAMIHEDILLIPYAMSDSATTFATVSVSELLAAMY